MGNACRKNKRTTVLVQPENVIVPESGKESEDEWNYIKENTRNGAVQEIISENSTVSSECDLALPKVSTPTIEKIAFVIEVEEPALVAELISIQVETSTEPIAIDEPAVSPVVSNLISDECVHPNIVAESESIVETTISNDVVAEATTIASTKGKSTKPAETKSKTSVAPKKRLSAGLAAKPKAKPSTVSDAAETKSTPIPRPRTAASQPPVKAIERKSLSSQAPKKSGNVNGKPTSTLSSAKRSASSTATSKSTTSTRASTATTTTTKVTAARLTTKTSASTTASDVPKRMAVTKTTNTSTTTLKPRFSFGKTDPYRS